MRFPTIVRRFLLWPVIAIFLAGTAFLNLKVFWTVWTSKSEVPWRDQWTYLDDARSILMHEAFWSKLWYCYWGHRTVAIRLMTLLDVGLFSGLNTPIVVVNLIMQTAQAVLLAYLAWRLLSRFGWAFPLIAAGITFHLVLSSLQLENLIWAGQFGYLLVTTAATAAFVLLAVYQRQAPARGTLILTGCIAMALAATLSRPDGTLVWFVLAFEAWLLRLSRRLRMAFVVAGGLVIFVYFYHYDPGPPLGMGFQHALLNLHQSLAVLGTLASGPLSVMSLPAGTWFGCLALATALYAVIKSLRTRDAPRPLIALATIVVFSLLTLLTMVTNRVSPEFVASRVGVPVLPSRYFTTPFILWASAWPICAWLFLTHRGTWPQFAIVSTMCVALTAGTVPMQLHEDKDWRAYYKRLDVAAGALIMDVHDPTNIALEQIYPDTPLRSKIRLWLQENRLSIFHERRDGLMGQHIPHQAFAAAPVCKGTVDVITPVGPGVSRIRGSVSKTAQRFDDLALVDSQGVVVGIARRGVAGMAGWEGYVRAPSFSDLTVLGVLHQPNTYCRLGK